MAPRPRDTDSTVEALLMPSNMNRRGAGGTSTSSSFPQKEDWRQSYPPTSMDLGERGNNSVAVLVDEEDENGTGNGRQFRSRPKDSGSKTGGGLAARRRNGRSRSRNGTGEALSVQNAGPGSSPTPPQRIGQNHFVKTLGGSSEFPLLKGEKERHSAALTFDSGGGSNSISRSRLLDVVRGPGNRPSAVDGADMKQGSNSSEVNVAAGGSGERGRQSGLRVSTRRASSPVGPRARPHSPTHGFSANVASSKTLPLWAPISAEQTLGGPGLLRGSSQGGSLSRPASPMSSSSPSTFHQGRWSPRAVGALGGTLQRRAGDRGGLMPSGRTGGSPRSLAGASSPTRRMVAMRPVSPTRPREEELVTYLPRSGATHDLSQMWQDALQRSQASVARFALPLQRGILAGPQALQKAYEEGLAAAWNGMEHTAAQGQLALGKVRSAVFERVDGERSCCPRCRGSGLLRQGAAFPLPRMGWMAGGFSQPSKPSTQGEACWFCQGIGVMPIFDLEGYLVARSPALLTTTLASSSPMLTPGHAAVALPDNRAPRAEPSSALRGAGGNRRRRGRRLPGASGNIWGQGSAEVLEEDQGVEAGAGDVGPWHQQAPGSAMKGLLPLYLGKFPESRCSIRVSRLPRAVRRNLFESVPLVLAQGGAGIGKAGSSTVDQVRMLQMQLFGTVLKPSVPRVPALRSPIAGRGKEGAQLGRQQGDSAGREPQRQGRPSPGKDSYSGGRFVRGKGNYGEKSAREEPASRAGLRRGGRGAAPRFGGTSRSSESDATTTDKVGTPRTPLLRNRHQLPLEGPQEESGSADASQRVSTPRRRWMEAGARPAGHASKAATQEDRVLVADSRRAGGAAGVGGEGVEAAPKAGALRSPRRLDRNRVREQAQRHAFERARWRQHQLLSSAAMMPDRDDANETARAGWRRPYHDSVVEG